jgi:glycosyltransferase involved in cell wall biosynthesis
MPPMSDAPPPIGFPVGVTVVIPAYNESARIAATVRAAQRIDGVVHVVVVDDGSTDDTATVAGAVGADVVRAPRNEGKAAALERGARAATAREQRDGVTGRPLLLLDADLGDSATAAGALLEPLRTGRADVVIATLPAQPGGGRGFVVRLAREGIRDATGYESTQPLSGQRALLRPAFDAALPLARGWGIEVGMTIDLLRAGYRVVEQPVDLRHRVTGKDFHAQVHRGRQFWGVWRALRSRGVGPALPIPR